MKLSFKYTYSQNVIVQQISNIKTFINKILYIFDTKSLKPKVFYIYNISQFKLATFQVFTGHMWPVSTALDAAALGDLRWYISGSGHLNDLVQVI